MQEKKKKEPGIDGISRKQTAREQTSTTHTNNYSSRKWTRHISLKGREIKKKKKKAEKSDWIIKQGLTIYCIWETHFKHRDRLKVKGFKKIHNINTNYKKTEMAILTLNKVDFRGTKNITKNKEGYFIIIKVNH